MPKYISFPRVEGTASRQAHADLPKGTYQRELGKEGFYGPSTQMYHRHPPTGWTSWQGPLRPRAFDLTKLVPAQKADPWAAPDILSNASLRFRYWTLPKSMSELARNADGDELLFVHQGAGDFFCDYGHLALSSGDYVVIPRGTMWRIDCSAPMSMFLIEATGSSYQLPDRGIVGAHAIFDPAMLDVPAIDAEFRSQQEPSGEWRVNVKRRNQISTVTYPFNPLDAVGWHGDLAPVRLNVKDIRPLASHRAHLPPSAHTTFVADRFVVATFVPRPFETDPGAIKVPFFHNNDDYDEVIFYHAGDFFSRDNIKPGMLTFHPSGFTHGPHPKALESMLEQKKPATDEYAVMIDARDALDVGQAASGIESTGYADSWKTEAPMKLASLKSGRDGELALVSRDLRSAFALPGTLQTALDHWTEVEPKLTALSAALDDGKVPKVFPFEPDRCAAPLPRAYQWTDGSAYVVHVELVRKARGADMPASFWTDPLIYQGGSDIFLGPVDPIVIADEAWGADFEAEIAVITDDVPMGVSAQDAGRHIKLVMLANDVSLRGLIPAELAKGFGFYQSKPWTSFSPVAITPDELGDAWNGGSIDLPLVTKLNDEVFGRPNARTGMVFDFPRLIAHATKTRPLGAGTIIGSGTVANEDRSVGSSCIVERRAIEAIERKPTQTPFLKYGDRVRIEMFDSEGRSIFGAIDQTVARPV